MNSLVKAALMGALGGVAGQLDSAAKMIRDNDLPLDVRLERTEEIVRKIADRAGPAGDVLEALADLLDEARRA